MKLLPTMSQFAGSSPYAFVSVYYRVYMELILCVFLDMRNSTDVMC